ncbi:MAG: sugar MFS transporter [Acidobacteriaceae bacterium]|nr:sugar MFS transporter [Acidobacteriaceae bacterium]
MAVPLRNPSAPGYREDAYSKTDTRAMSVATALFFMVGFLTCLNDVVIPHLKSIFELSYAEAMLVQFAFFMSYFVFSYPGGKLVDKFGYKKTMVAGLLVMAVGAAGFIPASYFAVYAIFLGALIILAAGMTIVQVAVNPYVTVIGPSSTASSRLVLAQAFNSVGTFIAPLIGARFILKGIGELKPAQMHSLSAAALQSYRATQASSVRMPYIGMTLMLVLLAVALATIKLKTTTGVSEHTQDFRPGAFAEALSSSQSIWSKPWLIGGALGIFAYVGAEVSIGSLLVNYMGEKSIAGLPENQAAQFLMVYWGGAMIGRFIGSAILQKVKTGLLLGFTAIVALALVITSMNAHGFTGIYGTTHIFAYVGGLTQTLVPHSVAMWTLLGVGFFNSVMFPSIFTLGIQDLGSLTSKGSSLMVAAIVGGAILPLTTGKLADLHGPQAALIIPALCYVYITLYGLMSTRRPPVLEPVV